MQIVQSLSITLWPLLLYDDFVQVSCKVIGRPIGRVPEGQRQTSVLESQVYGGDSKQERLPIGDCDPDATFGKGALWRNPYASSTVFSLLLKDEESHDEQVVMVKTCSRGDQNNYQPDSGRGLGRSLGSEKVA